MEVLAATYTSFAIVSAERVTRLELYSIFRSSAGKSYQDTPIIDCFD
jgi:hypothetical protein